MGHAWLYVLFLFSSVISGFAQVPIKPTVTLRPNWPLIYKGEKVVLRCEIPGGEGSQWMYEWRTARLNEGQASNENITIASVAESHSGEYSCRGTSGDGSTSWSDVVVLTVYKLSVSPSWLSPGASVTLSCEVQHPPAGTRFFWYKAVPKPLNIFYNYELLPGSSDGTDENVYIVHGLNNTAGYVCEAGRGKPKYRDPSFVWSADPRPAASLSVNPDRVQHFRSESVTLSCEGNSAGWRVMRFTEIGYLSDCSDWGKMNGSTCTIDRKWSVSGVYWCESGSGEFSNAVNITVQVTVSSPVSSSFPVMLIVGPVVGVVLFILIILVLLLWCCRRSKGLWCIRSKQAEGRGQTSNTNHGVNNTEDNDYRSPPQDNTNLYASVKSSEATGNAADEPRDVTYSHIELKDVDRTRRPREAEESAVYSEVKLQE
ncbi:uncharacterized protein LOC103145999 isoform X2 [Poecilia formosa]|uniref:uncharacterized protein LOC103145999 isoform X2 n=1 Tax=Poecilia formosa TaxID=48698 RepID=UPI0007BA5628|nr:PREDICTED: uncharacterized protein LOC103145999 isoform X2 [Poecilia formosa]